MVTIIDENYEGITKRVDNRYEIDEVLCEGDLEIRVPLIIINNLRCGGHVTSASSLRVGWDALIEGCLTVMGSLVVNGCLTVNGNTLIGESLTVKKDVIANESITVGGNSTVRGSLIVNGFISMAWGLTVNEDLVINGELTSKFGILLLGKYSVMFTTEYITIGCQRHSVEEWKGFMDAEIGVMDIGALGWWQIHKELVLYTHKNLPDCW